MMLPLKEIFDRYDFNPKSVIQVGSHFCEEHEEFVKCGIERFVYIEPCKDAFDVMNKKAFGESAKYVTLINVACGAEEKEMPMYVSHQNQGQSNSLLKPNLHTQQHPDIVFDDAEVVKVVTLDSLKVTGDLLVMDCQGYEGEVLKGGIDTIKQVSAIYTEVNRGQTYEGNMEINEMDAFLAEYRFTRVQTYWPSPNWTWGDAIFIRKSLL